MPKQLRRLPRVLCMFVCALGVFVSSMSVRTPFMCACVCVCVCVCAEEVIYIDTDASESQGLSNTAIIGIAVGSAVVALCFASVWIALVACCCMLNRRMTTKASAFVRSPSPSEK